MWNSQGNHQDNNDNIFKLIANGKFTPGKEAIKDARNSCSSDPFKRIRVSGNVREENSKKLNYFDSNKGKENIGNVNQINRNESNDGSIFTRYYTDRFIGMTLKFSNLEMRIVEMESILTGKLDKLGDLRDFNERIESTLSSRTEDILRAGQEMADKRVEDNFKIEIKKLEKLMTSRLEKTNKKLDLILAKIETFSIPRRETVRLQTENLQNIESTNTITKKITALDKKIKNMGKRVAKMQTAKKKNTLEIDNQLIHLEHPYAQC